MYHEDSVGTRGILLNRATDLQLTDDDFVSDDGTPLDDANKENTWKIWFGGDVRGLDSDDPDIVCLHTLSGEDADNVSEDVISGIKVS